MTTRYLVYGVTGTGKSTLAAGISARTGIPWHSVDDEFGWLPGWVDRPVDEQRAISARICAEDAWVLDSAYGAWRDLVMARAELIVALDYPRWVSLTQLLRRSIRRARSGERTCNGNVETWRRLMARDSIIVWHFRSFARKRATIRSWGSAVGGVPVARLTSRRATRQWLATLEG